MLFEPTKTEPAFASLMFSFVALFFLGGCGDTKEVAENVAKQNTQADASDTSSSTKDAAPQETSPAQRDEKPTTDIWTAVSIGNKRAVERFLDTGTGVDASFQLPGVPGSGGTPLHISAIANQKEIAELLIARGANIEAKAKDAFGGTPLHWAAFFGKPEIAAVLIEAGADVQAKDKNGFTPLDATLGQTAAGKVKVAELLKRAGASSTVAIPNGEATIWISATTGDVAAIKKHIESGADLDSPEPQGGSTLLLLAAFAGRLDVVKLLVEYDADINARNNEGSTALSSSAFAGHTEVVQLLINKGADVSLKDVRGNTAYDAVKGPWTKDVEALYNAIGSLLNVQFDLDRIKIERPKIQAILKAAAEK